MRAQSKMMIQEIHLQLQVQLVLRVVHAPQVDYQQEVVVLMTFHFHRQRQERHHRYLLIMMDYQKKPPLSSKVSSFS
jgi:hypothetical protein